MKYKYINIVFLWLILALLNTLILRQFIDFKISILLIHSLIRVVVFTFLTLSLKRLLAFWNFQSILSFQKYVNYSLLTILMIIIWCGAGILTDFLLFENAIANVFLKINLIYIPFAVILSLFIMQNTEYQINKKLFEEIPPSEENFEKESPRSEKVEILEKIAVRSNSKINVISTDELYFLSSEGDYVMLHTENAKYLKEQTMKYFEWHLPDKFLRVHRSYIVNVEKISRIELLEKQTYYLFLKNSVKIKMSTAGYKKLREKLGI